MADVSKTNYRSLAADEIRQLTEQGCTAEDWGGVRVAEPFRSERLRKVEFVGTVMLGSMAGEAQLAGAAAKPCGIYQARVQDCVVGDGVRIANVGSHLVGYEIGENVLIENIGVMETHQGAQ